MKPNPIGVRNPRTGEIDHWLQQDCEADIDAACASMRQAQVGWARAGLEQRAQWLRRWADEIDRMAGPIGDAEFRDTGRWRLSHEVPGMVSRGIRDWCDKAPQILARAHLEGHSTSHPYVSFSTRMHPVPLVGVISPWNHPFLLATLDAIPAVLAGCAVLIKPSEIAPRFIDAVEESLRAVPELAAVLKFLRGGPDVGQALVERVDMMCFTGSIRTGRLVAQACARRLIPAFLEMGGKDAAIVTADADLERAATAILRGSVHATGQICFSTERVYVHESVHDQLVELLCRKSDELALTHPDPRSGHIGPFIFAGQAAIVDAHIDDALAQGATLRCGGKSEVLGGGHYMRPTVLTDVTHEMRIMREETFGPVTPVMRYRDEAEALRLANDSEYGLSGAVFAGTVEQATRIAQGMQAGAVALQDAALTIAIMRDGEKVSFKQSGLGGSRMGPNAILRFHVKQLLMLNTGDVIGMPALGESAEAA